MEKVLGLKMVAAGLSFESAIVFMFVLRCSLSV